LRAKEYRCKHPQAGPVTDVVCGCKAKDARLGCWKLDPTTGLIRPSRVIRFDRDNLAPGRDGDRMNPSLLPVGDGYLYTWRNYWSGADTYAIRLDADFRPRGSPVKLDLFLPQASTTREDARLFWHRGRLHVWYTGSMRRRGRKIVSVCFARLDERTLATECRFYPALPGRGAEYEKNWAMFDHAGRLYAVYGTLPEHRVLRIECGLATMAHVTPNPSAYSGHYARGGASPWLHNGEYYHWFHGYGAERGRRVYNMGVCTFEAKPPFRVLRMTRRPVAVADVRDNPKVAQDTAGYKHSHVVFPCGAFPLGDQWAVSVGVHDVWGEVRFYPMRELERRLEPV
jgi:predicted GH43/DUF377 family glycosyl hydrolase